MKVDVRDIILNLITKKGEARLSDITEVAGFSRAYINRFFRKLRDEGKIMLLGKANNARYIMAERPVIIKARKNITSVHRILRNRDLAEDLVFDEIKKDTGIFWKIPENITNILNYAFNEMLNNAIEHSESHFIEITMKKEDEGICFEVKDKGIGILNSIMRKKKLNNEMEAIQDLLKGKLTTAPEAHSGEGIFFTSKTADTFIIRGSKKEIFFNNIIDEVFIRDLKDVKGTKVKFYIKINSKKELNSVFREYSDDSFEFSKTKVKVKLYKMNSEYISRSQARRVLSGLDKFKTIFLDFKGVKIIGQGFADEVFRVWKLRYPEINIIPQNTDENVEFMIDRAQTKRS